MRNVNPSVDWKNKVLVMGLISVRVQTQFYQSTSKYNHHEKKFLLRRHPAGLWLDSQSSGTIAVFYAFVNVSSIDQRPSDNEQGQKKKPVVLAV